MDDTSLVNHSGDLQIIWDALVRRDGIPTRVDAVVIGGCGDMGLADRAAELYQAGVSDLFVATGYRPEGDTMTEAELLTNKCMELGMPRGVLVLEKEASNTGENILFVAEIVRNMKPNAKSVVLIHKPFMSLRFLATAEAQWLNPQPTFYTTCQSLSFEEYIQKRGLEATAWEMLGDFKRMDDYVARGYQTAQPIPQAAREAYEKIIGDGFVTR